MLDYGIYQLRDNPFPENPMVDPFNDDARLNGSIFCEAIAKEEVASLRDKLASMTNVIYVAGLRSERGIGKSALIVHEWRRLKQEPQSTSVYIRCKKADKPSEFSGIIVSKWHEENYLWHAFQELLLRYSKETKDTRLTPEAVETLFGVYKFPPDRFSLALYTHYKSLDDITQRFSKWLSSSLGLSHELSYRWAYFYLSDPSGFVSELCAAKTRKVDKTLLLGEMLRVLGAAGFKKHYILMDQLEDTVMALADSKVGDFCLDMRRLLETVAGKAVIVATLHPDSELKLDRPEGENLRTMAPLDALHRVNVIDLESDGDEALVLTAEYLKRFRASEPSSEVYPFEPDALRYICDLRQGNKREFLAILCSCLKYGALTKTKEITLDFIVQHPLETIGQKVDPAGLGKFKQEMVKHV